MTSHTSHPRQAGAHTAACRSPRSRRQLWVARASAAAALGLLAAGAGTAYGAEGPATRTGTTGGTPYGGFTSTASATPLRIEIYEPAIPVPATPQAELNFSYSQVSGATGPATTALASAMWPGNAVGNGLPAIFANVGLPAHLLGNGYPVRADAQYPGSPSSASQEFLPGMVGRVSGSDTRTVARSGYSTSGQVAGDDGSSGGSDTSSLLDQLQGGNLGALGGLLNGPGSDTDTSSNPLGLLSALVSVGGMSSSSVTDYSDPGTVTATATSRLGEVDLLGGLVKLEGVTVSSASSSSLEGGKAAQKVTYGAMSIAGTPFKLTSDGIEASGSTTAIPGLPDAPAAALKQLGISIELPKPTKTTSGTEVSGEATGPTITIDTQTVMGLLSLDKLPLSDLLGQLPSSADQLKGLVQAVLTAHPKIVVALGDVTTTVQTIAAITPPSGGGTTPPPAGAGTGTTGTGTTSTGSTGGGSVGPAPSSTPPPAGTGPVTAPQLQATAALSNLPPLGSVPMLLTLGGVILAAGAAWFFRAAALNALGAGSTCSHGLATGLPDLRKA